MSAAGDAERDDGGGMTGLLWMDGERPISAGLCLRPAPEGEAPRVALARGPNRYGLGTGGKKMGRRAKRRPG